MSAAAGDGANNTLWNVENLRFCVGMDANNKCNAFYDVPANPSAPAAAPAIDLSAYSLTFAPADIGVRQADHGDQRRNGPPGRLGGDDERPVVAVHGHQRLHDAGAIGVLHRPRDVLTDTGGDRSTFSHAENRSNAPGALQRPSLSTGRSAVFLRRRWDRQWPSDQ